MAQQPATSFTRSGTSAILAKTAHDQPTVVETRQIPFDLRPLLEPYKHVGKVTVRVEKVPQRGRFSAGKNNGNQSWSLTADELEGLLYILPADIDEPHSLGIRVVSQVDGTSVAVLSYRVFPKEISTVVEKAPAAPRFVPQVMLREQLAQAEDRVKRTEAQAADRMKLTEVQAEERLKRVEEEWQQRSHELVDTALKMAKSEWDIEFSSQLNSVVERAEQTLTERRAAWQAELETTLAEANKRAEASQAQARESWKRDADAALLAARESWKSEEVARLAAAEMGWRGEARTAEADAQARLEKNQHDGAELARLREHITETERAAQLRDRELEKARNELEAAQANAQAASEAHLARAKASWTAEVSTRLSELEARLRAEHEAALAEASGRRDRAERALSEAVKQIELVSARRAEGAAASNQEVESLRANLTASHAAAAQAVKDAEARIEEAHARWKAEEETRLAAAEARIRAEAVTTSREVSELRLQADAALFEAHQKTLLAETEQKKRADLEEELFALGVSQKARDAELFELREQARQSAEAALAEAHKDWSEREAARLKEAEARLRGELERAISDAGQRAELAERQFAELKAQGDANPRERIEILKLRDEIEKMRLTVDAREAEIKSARMEFNASLYAPPPPPVTRTVILERAQQEKKNRRNLVRDAILVAVVVFVTALSSYSRPWIEPFLPYDMQEELDRRFGPLLVAAPVAPAQPRKPTRAPAAAPAPIAPAPPMETALNETSLHSAPSNAAVILATLPAGSKVQVLDDDGNWVHVFVGSTTTGQDGWVHHSDLSAPGH
jgi:hypothetical protein